MLMNLRIRLQDTDNSHTNMIVCKWVEYNGEFNSQFESSSYQHLFILKFEFIAIKCIMSQSATVFIMRII